MTEDTKGEELGVLFPDGGLTVTDPETGERVELAVEAFRFLPGLKAAAIGRPLIDALADAVNADADMELDDMTDLLAEHAETWMELIALASGRDPAWISALPETDGHALANVMWEVNGDFLARRAVLRAARKQRRKTPKKRTGSRSPKSSTPSSGPATG